MLTARSLTKTFPGPDGPVVAVDGVDLDVAAGEVVGFLGPNGAGKSTTQRMLTTLLPLEGGSATVAGHDVRSDPAGVRRSIGYVAQLGGGATELPVRDELVHQGRLYRLRGRDLDRRVDEVVERFSLGPLADRPGVSLSGGQRRRFEVALGLVHRPPLLFLDEPTTGLDPQSRAALWDQVRALRIEDGTAVLLTTHYLDEADALCDRVLIIDHGRVVASGTPDGLRRDLGGDVVTVTVPAAEAARAAAVARRVDGAREVVVAGPALHVSADPGIGAGVVLALGTAGVPMADLTVTRPTLDDVFLTLTGRSLREQGPALATTGAPT